MKIKYALSALLLAVCGMTSAQTYLNVKTADNKYKSFEVTEELELTWGEKLEKDPAEGININSPVGTIGMLNGREAIVVDLGTAEAPNKVAIATMNVGATSIDVAPDCYGNLLNFNDANDETKTGLKDGWYVPSKEELEALSAKLTWQAATENKCAGRVWQVTETASLFLPAAGFELSGSHYGKGVLGFYWSSTDYNSEDAWYLEFDSGSCGMHTYFRQDSQSVRPFCALPAE